MQALRTFLGSRPLLAALVFAAALLMRVAVPTGMMPVIGDGTIELALCDGHGPVTAAAMPGMHHGEHGGSHHDQKNVPCDFAGLSVAHVGGADPIQVAIALVFIAVMALLAPRPSALRRARRLLPPLRGPPLAA